MIGTVLLAVELREHDVEDHKIDVVLVEAHERLLTVPSLHDPEALPFQGEGKKLLHGFFVVDEEDGRVLSHRDTG
jgi:hypothetical protein